MSTVLGLSDFEYIGSFGITQPTSSVYCVDLGQTGDTDCKGFPGGLGFNPPNSTSGTLGTSGSLLLEGQLGAPNGQQYCKGNPVVAEVQIPPDSQINPNSGGDVTQLTRASNIQVGFLLLASNGVSFGTEYQTIGNGVGIGGMIVYNNRIYWNFYDTYTTGVPNTNVFGYSGTTLSTSSTGTAVGHTAPGTNVPNDAWGVGTGEDAGGYIAEISSNWQSSFNNRTHFCGLGGVSEVSRCSNGPAMHCFNIADIGTGTSPSSSDTFLSYPSGHALRFANGTKGWGVYYAPDGSVLGQDDTLGMMSGAFFMDDGNKMGVCFLTHLPAGTGWYGFGTFWAWQRDSSSGISDLTAPAKGTVWTMPSGRTFVVDNIPPLAPGCTFRELIIDSGAQRDCNRFSQFGGVK